MATFVNDTFTATDNTLLTAHTGETGATWTKHGSSSAGTASIFSNRLHPDSDAMNLMYYASGAPAAADYYVQADFVCISDESTTDTGITGRHDTAADTFYMARWDRAAASWQLWKRVAGTFTQLGSNVSDTSLETPATSKTCKLQMVGTSISLYVSGTLTIGPITDSSISAAGRAGVRLSKGTSTLGIHLDNFSAADVSSATHFGPFTGDLAMVEDIVVEWTTSAGGMLLTGVG